MADTAISITAGTGTNVDTRTEATNGNHRQVIVLGDPSTNAGVAPVDATAGLKVDLGADNDITGTVTANLSATDNAVLDTIDTSTAAMNAKMVSGTDIGDVTINNAAGASAVNVQDGGNSLTVDGTVTANLSATDNAVLDAIQVGTDKIIAAPATAAKQPALGTAGTASADVITVQGKALMTPVLVDGSATTQPVSGTFYQATQPVSGTVTANAGTGTMTVDLGVNNDVTVTNATATNLKAEVVGTGTFATQATLQTGSNAIGKLAANSGVDIGDVDVTSISAGTNTIGDVGLKPRTTGGSSTYHLVSAATTNATNIKASAGQVFGWYLYNSNAAARKVVFHNTAGTPTAGASVFFSIMLPPSAAANVFTEIGIAFSTGIAITTVTGLADSDTAAVAANDLIINIFYA